MKTIPQPPKEQVFSNPQAHLHTAKLHERINIRLMHRFAGLTLATFIAMHLTNHLFATVSVEKHIKVMEMLRLFYRNPIIETLLLLAICIQVPSGVMLARRKGWRGLPLEERAQVASGLYLSFFLVAHVFAVMVGRYFLHVDTNFYFASAPLLSFLWLYYVVYYGLSVIAIFTHIASIHTIKMTDRTTLQRARQQGMVIFVLGVMISIVILLTFSGVLYRIHLPAAYQW
jgi:succinate dehydrogenase/fumarate reductase cytochrome b subunit